MHVSVVYFYNEQTMFYVNYSAFSRRHPYSTGQQPSTARLTSLFRQIGRSQLLVALFERSAAVIRVEHLAQSVHRHHIGSESDQRFVLARVGYFRAHQNAASSPTNMSHHVTTANRHLLVGAQLLVIRNIYANCMVDCHRNSFMFGSF